MQQVFIFSIKRDDLKDAWGETKKQFEKELRTHFPSADFMRGYADGYGFGKIKIYTLDEYQNMLNNITHHYNFIYFVYVDEEV